MCVEKGRQGGNISRLGSGIIGQMMPLTEVGISARQINFGGNDDSGTC